MAAGVRHGVAQSAAGPEVLAWPSVWGRLVVDAVSMPCFGVRQDRRPLELLREAGNGGRDKIVWQVARVAALPKGKRLTPNRTFAASDP